MNICPFAPPALSPMKTPRLQVSTYLALVFLGGFVFGCSSQDKVSNADQVSTNAAELPAPEPREIKSAIQKNIDRVQQCFIAGTFKNAELKGTVQVTFTIEPTGQVSDIFNDGSDMSDSKVIECVMDIVKNTSFPRGGRFSQEITYPFHFAGHS